MAVRAVDPQATIEYSLKADTGEDRTVFVLGVMDARLRRYVMDHASRLSGEGKQTETTFSAGTWAWLTVKYGLRGWRGLLNAAGGVLEEAFDQVPVHGKSYQAVADRVLDVLPVDVLDELAGRISQLNTFGEGDKAPLESSSS